MSNSLDDDPAVRKRKDYKFDSKEKKSDSFIFVVEHRTLEIQQVEQGV